MFATSFFTSDASTALMAKSNIMQRPPGAFIPLTVDSGCNQTLVQSPRWFIDGSYAEEKSGAIYINGASESGNTTGNLRVHGFGDAQLTTICSRTGNLVDIRMPGAQYVPDLSVDMLMAVSSMCSYGHTVVFSKDSGYIDISDLEAQQCQRVHLDVHNGLYHLLAVPPCPDPTTSTVCMHALSSQQSTKPDSDIWHQRFAHVNARYLQLMAGNELVNGGPAVKASEIDLSFCKACALSKIAKQSVSKEAAPRDSTPMTYLHMDIIPISTVSRHGGFRSALIIVDDATRFTWIHFLKGKDDALPTFQNWVTTVLVPYRAKRLEKYTGAGILLEFHSSYLAKVQSDSESLFKSPAWVKYVTSLGGRSQFSPPDSQGMNGICERKVRTLKEATTANLKHANQPRDMWNFAMAHAVSAINVIPTSGIDLEIPYTALWETTPDVSCMRVWGCPAFPAKPGNIGSLEGRGRDGCIFVGYSNNNISYQLLCSNQIRESL